MERIVNGVVFEGKRIPDAWDVRVFEVNGHREVSARQCTEWVEKYTLPFDYKLDDFDPIKDAELLAERAERSLEKSAKRAQTMCRRVIKSEGFDELLTLTYRENQSDRSLCKKHFAEWMRRMKVALGEFRFCASFEVQQRGSMHVHIATHKLPIHAKYKGVKVEAWKLGTRIWRSIVGADNGMCFVGGMTRHGGRRRNMSLGKMASYVSKYIMKDYKDAPPNSSRYSRSHGVVLPKPKLTRLTNCSFLELITVAFTCEDGDVILSHRLGKYGDSYWLCTEPAPQKFH